MRELQAQSAHGRRRGLSTLNPRMLGIETLTTDLSRTGREREYVLAAGDDPGIVVSDQAQRSRARDTGDRSRNRTHGAVKVSGLLGDAQRPRTNPGLHNDRRGRHRRQEPGSLDEPPPGR